MTARPGAVALTVLLAPRGESDEILSVLADYAAIGLVNPFVCVDAADVGGTSVPATLASGGRSSAVVLQQVLTEHRYRRVRVAVLVPLDAPASEQVSRTAEQKLEQVVRASVVATPVTLLRLLFTRGAPAPRGARNYDAGLLLEGWHNLLVAPEDSIGPGLGSVALDRLSDRLDVAQHVAPVVASVAGLWRGIDRVVFDDVAILPGATLRAVRAFYRRLDTTAIEDQLRLQVFDSGGRLPLPRSVQVPVVYIPDVALATQTLARALWTKHRNVLRGGRVEVGGQPAQGISVWSACKIFLSFLWAALRNAPAAWLQGMLGSVRSAVATTVQHAVFGRSESLFAVVGGTEPASWQDAGQQADAMSTMLGEPESGERQRAQTDLTPLWVDYVNGALTLADGGRRSTGMDPVKVGATVGVVHDSADVVPSRADAFTAIPPSLAAVIGVPQIQGGDVLGTADVKVRLERTFSDSAAGVEARHTFAGVAGWEAAREKSYAAQVGSILADFLGRARGEVAELLGQISEFGIDAVDEKLRRRQRVIATITRTAGWSVFVALVVLLVLAAVGLAGWAFTLWVVGIVLAIYLFASLGLFVLVQRHLFAELNRRNAEVTELEAMQFNLRAALADVSRLSSAYGQLLAWNRVLGELLRTPFGQVAAGPATSSHAIDGLPRSVQIGAAAPASGATESTAQSLQQQLYAVGWLSGPWTRLLDSARERLHADPAELFRLPGAGSGSVLDQWSSDVGSGNTRIEGADALWREIQATFDDPAAGVADAMTGGVRISPAGQQVSLAQFSAGVLQRAGQAAPFDASLFTDTAVTAGHSAVAIDDAGVDRHGLGYQAAVVQASDGLPAYDFAIFADYLLPAVGGDDDIPPESGSMVF